jgi:hypothetical protein
MMSEIGRIAWQRWTIVGEVYGDFQARLFAALFYFTIFVPFALGVRLLSDPLRLRGTKKKRLRGTKKKKRKNGSWLHRAPVGNTLDDARRQF